MKKSNAAPSTRRNTKMSVKAPPKAAPPTKAPPRAAAASGAGARPAPPRPTPSKSPAASKGPPPRSVVGGKSPAMSKGPASRAMSGAKSPAASKGPASRMNTVRREKSPHSSKRSQKSSTTSKTSTTRRTQTVQQKSSKSSCKSTKRGGSSPSSSKKQSLAGGPGSATGSSISDKNNGSDTATPANATKGASGGIYHHLEVSPAVAERLTALAAAKTPVTPLTPVTPITPASPVNPAVDPILPEVEPPGAVVAPLTPADDQEIQKEAYYHGLLPREDAERMLRKQGDFLVRRSQVGDQAGVNSDVVSVMWNKKKLHFIIEKKADGNVSLGESVESNTMLGLINAYRSRDYQLTEKTGALLLNPVPRQDWELQHEHIFLTQKLGEGAFGEVFKGQLVQYEKGKPEPQTTDVAVKKHFDETVSKTDIEVMMREARIMRQYKHINVVRFYGVAVQQQPILLVMELVSGGSLDKYLRKNKETVEDGHRLQFCLDAAKGLKYLHSLKSIHRDIAARNCLVDVSQENRVKISDFGLAKQSNTYHMSGRGKLPVRWLAPETLIRLDYSKKTDVWSYGVLVWEIYTNCEEEPYFPMTSKELQTAIKEGYRLPQPILMGGLVKEMCDRCWLEAPKTRPAFYLIAKYLKDLQRNAPNPSLDKAAKPAGGKKSLKTGKGSVAGKKHPKKT